MPIGDGHASTPDDARSIEAGMLLIAAGALLLLVSLFLHWYQPGIDAWEIFEVWDLVLAVLAIVALTALAGRIGIGKPRPASWLAVPAGAVLVIVLFSIINPPPLSRTVDGDPDTGLWLALAASVLMAAGALLSVARISVAFSAVPHEGATAPWSRKRPAHKPGTGAGSDAAHDPRVAAPRVSDPSPAHPSPAPGEEPTSKL